MIKFILAFLLFLTPAQAGDMESAKAPLVRGKMPVSDEDIRLLPELAQANTPASAGIAPEGGASSGAVTTETSEAAALQHWGQTHPDCAEWTDECFVCRRSSDGRIGCSTAGIACTPARPLCRDAQPVTIPGLTPGRMPGQTAAPEMIPGPVAPGAAPSNRVQ